MSLIMPPTSGESVSILGPHSRVRGHVTGRAPEALTVELEETPIRRPFRFPRGAHVEVEWTDPQGVMQITATVGSSSEEPHPTLELQLVGAAEPVERRDHERVSLNLEVSAWTLAQPTRRLTGHTVDLSVGGALLSLPELAPYAATVELPNRSAGETASGLRGCALEARPWAGRGPLRADQSGRAGAAGRLPPWASMNSSTRRHASSESRANSS